MLDGALEGPGSSSAREEERLPRWALAILAAVLVLGAVLRTAGTSGQVLNGDEPIAVSCVESGYRAVLTTFDGKGSHIGYSLLQRVSLDLYGPGVLGYRLPSIVAGLLTLVLLYPLGRRFVGAWPAWLATLLLSVHSMHVYYSRNGRPYTLAMLLLFLLVVAAGAGLRGRRGAWVGVAALVGVLPWVHLTALGPIAAVALVCLGWAVLRGTPRKEAVRDVVLAFAAGGVLAVLLYLPAWSGLSEYFQALLGKQKHPNLNAEKILQVYGGTLAGGVWFLVAGIVFAALRARREPREGLLLLAGLLTPLVVLLATRPAGVHFAQARYLMIGLAPALLASSDGLFRLLGRAPRVVAAAAGLAFLGYQVAAGPVDGHWLHGTFTNGSEELLEGHEIDPPFAGTPGVYAMIAREGRERPVTVLEYPYPAVARLLYRNYELQHGQRVLVGRKAEGDGLYGRVPYVPAGDVEDMPDLADWMVVHLDIRSEVNRFFASIGKAPYTLPCDLLAGQVKRLAESLGDPTYQDDFVWAWRFERGEER